MSEHSNKMVLEFPSDMKYLGAVDAAIQDLAREFSFSEGSINDVSTALIEACSNAIEHGNKFAEDKRVKVVLSFNGNGFRAQIHDQGDGFDFDSALGDTAAPDPFSERGRGILIMRAFTDGLSYSFSKGSGLCLELHKSSDGDEEPEDE